MKFLSIEIENFRQYAGKQMIEFSQDKDKNFTIIKGANGAGKTNLLSAIYWCFYNDEETSYSKYKDNKSLGILNESIVESMPDGERIRVSVKISLGEDSPEYILERYVVLEKNKSGSVYTIDESFRIMVQSDGGFVEEKNIELAINRILPKEIKNFFFFDGERLDAFFRIGSGTNIKKAVYDVSQIGLLKNTIKHLETVKRDIMKNHVDVDPEIQNIQKRVEMQEKLKIDKEEERDRLQKEIDDANSQIAEIDDFLRDNSIPQVKEKQKQREFYEDNLKTNLSRIDDLNENRKKLLIEQAPFIYSQKTIKSVLEKIEELDKNKSLPPDIKPSFVKKLLEEKICVCGSKIVSGSESEKKLKELITKNDYGENAKLLLEARAELDEVQEKNSEFKQRMKSFNDEIESIKLKNEDIKKSLKNISLQLEGVDAEEVSRKESQRTTLYNGVQKSSGNLALCKQDIEDLEGSIKDLNKQWSNLSGKKSENKEISLQIKLFEDSLTVVQNILNEIVDEVRMTIERKTNEYFLNLIWKKEAYKNVKIDDDYNLSVINKYGSECLGSLSAGERQVLALSFMAALKEVSGFDIPVVIDTPLGRISGEPRENIAKSLPKYLENTQVTLLMTDTEYTPKLKSILGERIGKEYDIKFDEKNSTSKVI